MIVNPKKKKKNWYQKDKNLKKFFNDSNCTLKENKKC
jgi:hypothetical protein